MTELQAAANAAEIVAAVAGVALARRRPEHRPAAMALAALAALVLLRLPVGAALRPLPRPVEGSAVILIYLDGAISLAVDAVLPGLALAACSTRPRRAVALLAASWLLASVVLGALYPSPIVRGEGLRRVYLAAELAAFAVTIAAFASWLRVRRSPSSAHIVAIGLALLDVAVLLNPLGPWRAGLFGVPFDPPQATILVGFVGLALYQGILWRFSSVSR